MVASYTRPQSHWRPRFRPLSGWLGRLLGVGALLASSLGAQAQLTGSKAIPGSGSTGYATLAAAITDLNTQGVGAGGVTFNLAPGYTETAANLLITATGTAANPIVFQKGTGTGANPTITGGVGISTTQDAFITLQGSDYVTFDGLTLTDPSTNTTVATQIEWGFALLKVGTPTVDGCQNVTIRNCVVTLRKGTLAVGIYANNHVPASTTQLTPTTAAGTNSNNKFYGNTISGVNNGVFLSGFAAASPYTLYDQGNEIGSVLSGTTATGNTITDFGTTATAYGIYAANQHGTKVQGNTVNSTPATGATAATSILYGIFVGTGGSADILGNTVTVNTGTTTATTYGLQNASGANGLSGAATTVNIANNSLTMTSATATTASFFGLYNTGATANLNIFGNTLSNWTRPATTSGFTYVLYVGTGATATQNVYGNTISNISSTGGGVYGYYAFNNSAAAVQYYDNVAQNLSCDGSSVYGMYLLGGNTLDVYRNRVSRLVSSSTFASVYGLYISPTTTTNVTNNLIGDFSTPSTSGTNAQTGLWLAGGSTANAQYNSIYLNGTSTGTNFGTTGIYFSSTATTLVTLRNNVVVNTSTAAGTGLTAALRRVSGFSGVIPGNLSTNTNNNLYYAGTPSATNLLYVEGTSSPLTNAIQNLTDYKNFLAGRETNAVTENPPFLSTVGTSADFLKVSTTVPTQIESGGLPITGITTDYANATRSTTTPDLGAYEGTYLPLDLSGPAITIATLNNTLSTANRTVVVTITDPSGVATGTGAPRLYYRKGTTGAFAFVNATSVSGSQYTFTFDYALVAGGSVAQGDVIQYYVSAQDLVATPNVSTTPGGGSGSTPPGTTAPTLLASFLIVGNMSGVYYVGTSTPPAGTPANRVFPTLTAAATAYNLNVLTGATTFYLLDAAYSTAETFPITFNANPSASATNSLLVTPYTGVSSTVTSSGTLSLLLLRAAKFITFDGANTAAGTTRDLTLASTNNTTANAVVWVGSLGAGAGTTNITLRNLNVVGANSTYFASFGIYATAAPDLTFTAPNTFTYGDDNDNLVIQNNAVTNAYTAIFARANGVATAYDGLQIVDNQIGATRTGTTTPVGNVTSKGIDIQGAAGPIIARNAILGMDGSATPATLTGIEVNSNVTNAVISRNSITGLRQVNVTSNSISVYGIHLASGTNITNAEISNNVVSDLASPAVIATTTQGAYGIRITTGTGTKVYYNSVNLFGSVAASTNSSAPSNVNAALYVASSAVTGLDVRNNIFANTITTTAATNTLKSYALYLANASSLAISDYNDYFVGGANGVLGYVATDIATLAALKTATARDASSVSTNPNFASTTSLLPANGQLANGGTPVSVTVDFTGAARPATAPSIGAYQVAPLTIDVAPVALLSPLNTSTANCFGANTAVTVQIRNNGSVALNFATTPLTVTALITSTSGPAQTLSQTISTGTLAAATTQTITFAALADFTAVASYTFAITATVTGDADPSNDLLAPAPVLNVVAPVAGTLSPASYAICTSGTATLSLAGAANGSIQFQQSSSATGPFTNVASTTGTSYITPVLTSTTYYRALVTCGTNVATSNVSAIMVNNPVISAAPSPLSTCSGGTVSLSATVPAGVSVRYFTTATGGTSVGTGNPYVTPALTASTTYYAEAYAPGGQENVGKPSTTGNDGANTVGGLYFTATGATTITNVTVYRSANAAAGTATIQLLSGNTTTGAPLATITVPVPANTTATVSPAVLTLNFAVPAAGQYTLYLSAASPALIRDFSTASQPATVYPYLSPSGLISITGPTLAGYYYYFYNWQTSSECVSTPRTPIVVSVAPGLVATLPAATANSCGRTPYQLAGTIAGTATGATYTSSGTGTFAPNATTLNATYTPSAADVTAGTVTITLTPTGSTASCTATAQVVLTLATPPNSAFSYPTTLFCTGAATTVTPVLAAGTVAGTFSTTGAGLRIDPVTGVINLATQTVAGTYTVTNTVTTTGVCNGASSTATITISQGVATPTLTAVAVAGGGVRLSTNAVTGAQYQFFVGGVAVGPASANATITVSPAPVSGSYTVVVSIPGGCSSAPSVPVVVTATATATLAGVSLRVYPNPTLDGHLTLELQGARAQASQLTILNALGQQVHTGTLAAGTTALDLAPLAAGVYTIRVQTAQGVLTQRVVRR